MPDGTAPETTGSILGDATTTPPTDSMTPPAGGPMTPPAGETVKTTPVEPTPQSSKADWAKSLPEGFEGLETLEKFGSLEELAKGYVHAEKLIGREKIPMPETEDEFAAAFKRLGAPETVEEYKLALPKEVDDRYKGVYERDLDWFGKAALANHLTNNQVQGLYKSYIEYQNEVLEGLKTVTLNSRNEALQILTEEHGDNLAEVLSNSSRVLKSFGDDSLINMLDETGLGNHVALVRMLNKIFPFIAEEKTIDSAPGQTQAQLDEALAQALADPAYLDSSKAGHRAAKEKVTKLMQQRYPG